VKCMFILKNRQAVLRRIGLHELLINVGLEDAIFKTVRTKVNGFQEFRSSILQASRLCQRHAAEEVGTRVPGSILLGLIEHLHGILKAAGGKEVDTLREFPFQRRFSGLRQTLRRRDRDGY